MCQDTVVKDKLQRRHFFAIKLLFLGLPVYVCRASEDWHWQGQWRKVATRISDPPATISHPRRIGNNNQNFPPVTPICADKYFDKSMDDLHDKSKTLFSVTKQRNIAKVMMIEDCHDCFTKNKNISYSWSR